MLLAERRLTWLFGAVVGPLVLVLRRRILNATTDRSRWRLLSALVCAVLLPLLQTAPAVHAEGCQFALGFAALHSALPDTVGACVDNQTFSAEGDAVQHTTRGLLTWRKSDSVTSFSDGYRSLAGRSR